MILFDGNGRVAFDGEAIADLFFMSLVSMAHGAKKEGASDEEFVDLITVTAKRALAESELISQDDFRRVTNDGLTLIYPEGKLDAS